MQRVPSGNHVSPYEALLEAKAISKKFPDSYFGAFLQARADATLHRGQGPGDGSTSSTTGAPEIDGP